MNRYKVYTHVLTEEKLYNIRLYEVKMIQMHSSSSVVDSLLQGVCTTYNIADRRF